MRLFLVLLGVMVPSLKRLATFKMYLETYLETYHVPSRTVERANMTSVSIIIGRHRSAGRNASKAVTAAPSGSDTCQG